jgi:2-oxoglutarate/2-oxoacid ferredoxin oxidoreductase subunit beta
MTPQKKENKNANLDEIKKNIGTNFEITWCPGCPNFLLLEAVKRAITRLISEGNKQEEFVMATGIGCHQKIFDYLNISGVYGLHGRVLPVLVGIKLANPNLIALGFAGDGDAYSEGMEHFVHSARYNLDATYLIANNQNFALTTGQATPTSQKGYKSKTNPYGEFSKPINPIKIALASGATFVARVNPKDIEGTADVIYKAIKHRGFSVIESIQDCLAFNTERSGLSEFMYKIPDNNEIKKAYEIADEWNYNGKGDKIAVGVIYQKDDKTMEEEWPQLKKLREEKVGWKGVK